ncbi:MAG: carboxylesterase/lipase family protein [Methyloligellaceae bacterium]
MKIPVLIMVASFIFCSLVSESVTAKSIKLTTDSGVLRGEQIKISNGSDNASSANVNVFKGVPFAKPPLGDLRWMPPQPIAWEGVREAKDYSSPCLQRTNADGSYNGAGVVGPSDEDCLYLNVWAPVKAKNAPIMLWIFGGGGVMGAGSVATYNGEAFARDGVILVTINYRLGALGGFAHPALSAEAEALGHPFGNFHLLDSMAALRWIKNNAEAFGGDPENITVFGESAGATITANLVTSPMAKGLFNKAVIESTGSLPTPATTLEAAEQQGVAALKTLGYPENISVADMRAIPAEDIIMNRGAGRGVRTILDGKVKTQSILDSFAAGNEIDVPMIIGTNSDEDRLRGTQLVATHAQSGAPVWQYFFDYVPEWRHQEQPNGAPHAAEIPYVFDTVKADRRVGEQMTETEEAVAARIHSCWVAFAKAPLSSKTIECADGFRWPARTDENHQRIAIFQMFPSLGYAKYLRSPPNGAEPGPTSRP